MKSRLVWLLLCAIWGSTWLFIKIGLASLPPISFAGIRFLIAAAILFLIIAIRKQPLPRHSSDWVLLALSGVLAFTLNYGLLFWGEQYISSGLAALLQATIPAFGLVIAHFYLPTERMTTARILGVLLGLAGVAVIFSNQLSLSGRRALAGSAALVLSSICVACSNVLIKARGKNLDPSIIAAGQMVCGFIPLLLVGFALEGNPFRFRWSGMAIGCLLYLAIVGSVVAFMLYYWLMRHMDVTKTMLIALVTPVFAVTLGMVVLDEALDWRTFAGGLMIVSGIGMMVLQQSRRRR